MSDHVMELWRRGTFTARQTALYFLAERLGPDDAQTLLDAVAAEGRPKERAAWQAWTKSDVELLRTLYTDCVPVSEIASQLGRTERTIRAAVDRYGLNGARRPSKKETP